MVDWTATEAHYFVHFDKIGAIPAKLSVGVRSTLFPISHMEFDDVCRGFDECEDFFTNGSISTVMTYLNYGFDIAFNNKSIERYKKYLLMSQEELEHSLENLSYFIDTQQNMEW
ncbi:MAG: hypothetical protein NUV41_16040 [Eubacteriales bacterium]|jgi:hypothetical protein|nr:hypothetical protein [Eubacteriales bacterium]